MPDAAHRIEQLRHWRRRSPPLSIGSEVKAVAVQAARTHRKLGQLIDLWESRVPADLVAHSSIAGLRGGVAHVLVDSASTAYELDRLLREGLLAQLRQHFRGTLVRVSVRIGHRL